MSTHGIILGPDGKPEPRDKPVYLPSIEEFEAVLEDIQSRWSERTRRERAGVHANPAVETRTVADPRPLTGD